MWTRHSYEVRKTQTGRGPATNRSLSEMHYQTSSAEEPPESGITGIGTLRPEAEAAALWLAGDEADLSTAVETHLMYLMRDSGLFACKGLSSGLAMNFLRTSWS